MIHFMPITNNDHIQMPLNQFDLIPKSARIINNYINLSQPYFNNILVDSFYKILPITTLLHTLHTFSGDPDSLTTAYPVLFSVPHCYTVSQMCYIMVHTVTLCPRYQN